MAIKIENAKAIDEDNVVALWIACGLVASPNDPVADFRFARSTSSADVLVGRDASGALVGAVMVGHDGHRGWLYYVASEPSARGSGIGRDMVRGAETWLRERGISKVQLMVRETNTTVVGFYERLGFEISPRVLMSKWLTEPSSPALPATADPQAIVNWRRLDERITTSGQPSEAQLADIRALGVRHVVNLGLHSHDKALPNEASSVTALGMTYIHIPVDFQNPTEADFARFCSVMAELRDVPVHVHCIANYRVSAFLFRYRRDVLGMDTDRAKADVDAIWQPDAVWTRFIDVTTGP